MSRSRDPDMVLPPLRAKTPKALPPLPPTPGGRRKFAKDSQLRCGVVQIIGGVSAMVLGVGAIVAGCGGKKGTDPGTNVYSSGIWCGLMMIIAGSLGVSSSKNEETGSIKACLVCSVLSSLCSVIFIGMSSSMYAIDADPNSYKSGSVLIILNSTLEARRNIDIISIVVGLLVFIVAIIQCAICGRALHYTSKRKRDQRVFFVAQPVDGKVPKVDQRGAVVIVQADGVYQHPRPKLPPIHRDDIANDNVPDTPPPRYQDE